MKGARAHILASVALLSLNVWICWRLFTVEYTNQFSSIEGAFIGIARYCSRHWGDFSWWPLWHCGMPYQDTYVPLLHLVVAVVATVAKVSAARAYHGVTGAAYSLGAVALYLLAVRLGASRGAAVFSALLFSLFSPAALLMPAFARDIGGWWFARRLQVLTVYGEGPHVSAMTLATVALAALEYALVKRTRGPSGLAAVAIALVFLTNVPGTMGLALAVFCWIAAQEAGKLKAAWSIAAGASLLAYAIACLGVPPSSVHTMLGNAGRMHSGFSASLKHAPYLLPLVLAAVAGAGYLLQRTRVPLVVRFAALYFALTAGLSLTARSEVFELLPQVGRLHLEMELAACLLLGAGGWALYTLVPRRLRPLLLVLGAALLVQQVRHYRWSARADIRPADPAARSEYTTARWLDEHMPGGRVYAMGSTSFWLNAFTDTRQVIGCCDQNESMPVLVALPYLVNTAVSPYYSGLSKLYLEALGAQALVTNGPESTDEYKDIRHPERFEQVLPILHRERGDTIYAIPQRSSSLAHVIRSGEEVPRPGIAPLDQALIERYVAAIEDSSRTAADFQWLRGGAARIRATLRRDELVSVQVAWFPGWKAFVGESRKEIHADGLGFMVIRPECQGDCEIRLEWSGRPDLPFAALISSGGLVVLGLLFYRRDSRLFVRL